MHPAGFRQTQEQRAEGLLRLAALIHEKHEEQAAAWWREYCNEKFPIIMEVTLNARVVSAVPVDLPRRGAHSGGWWSVE